MDEKVNAGDADSVQRVSTGIPGLDEVLLGGFLGEGVYLIQGNPGSGKTTLGMQFLIEGARHGESGLYVTFSESKKDIQAVAESHGWSLDGITLYEREGTSTRLKAEEEYTVFPADEVELRETTNPVYEEVERLQPRRVVVDSLSELRLMAKDPRRYRQQILFFKQFFSQRGCTVLLLDDQSGRDRDLQIQTVCHGVIELLRLDQQYGVSRRQLRVIKVRGSTFHDGLHDYIIQRGGLVVFPRLVAAEQRGDWHSPERLPSGLVELDALLGEGLDRGTSALLLGPRGAGKSALVTQYAFSRVEQGEAVACFVFEESRERFINRAAGFGRDLRSHVEAGRLTVRQVDPAELSPGEFAHSLKTSVEEHGARLVIIDSLNGYINAMPDERFLLLHMHELLMYLNQQGVLTLMTMTQHGVVAQMQSPVDISHLADSLILLRYFEAQGELKQAISVLKNRGSSHERTIREFQVTPTGIRIGQPLRQFRGVLSGVPTYRAEKRICSTPTTMPNEQGHEQRVLVVAPVGRDASLICDLLTRQGFGCESCVNVRELADKIGEGAGALLITDEALGGNVLGQLLEVLNRQPQWSDVPLILLTNSDNARTKLIDQNWARRRNVIVVDRPVRKVALTTAVRAALQDRTHQYQIRDHLEAEKHKDDQLRQSQKLESIGILAGGVAHDFNNLLTGILGNASLILDDISTGQPARDWAQEIRKAAQRAAELTRQLLAYSGRGKFIVEPIDLSSLVRDLSQLIGLSIPKNVFLHLDLNEALPPVEADSSQIQQVIMNLVINGAEAIGADRQGTVLVHTAVQNIDSEYIEGTFTPGEIEPGRYVLLEVQDTGCGMDESTVARIFDPFFTTKFTGRGLGLAAVVGIVRGHRGALRVYSTPGQGTTLKVLFPAIEKVSAEPRSLMESAGQRGSGTILVVDDEDVVRKIAKSALERAGYTVLLAESGQAAIDLFKTAAEQVSLVLLDMTMPGLSGHETFLQLRRVRPTVKVLLSSGFNELEATRPFSGQGLAGFIQKPYTAGTLSKTVSSVLLSRDEHG